MGNKRKKTLDINREQVESFCRRWHIVEMSVFGSFLRADFSQNSDVDVLVSFEEKSQWTLFDLLDMKEELESMWGRPVDLVEKEALRNPFRKKRILTDRRIIYAA